MLPNFKMRLKIEILIRKRYQYGNGTKFTLPDISSGNYEVNKRLWRDQSSGSIRHLINLRHSHRHFYHLNKN